MADNTIPDEAPSPDSSLQAVSNDTNALADSSLSKIPAEIRNEIYELVFTPDSSDATVDLLSAEPPSKALLLTCKQVHAEARGIYKSAYRQYWTNSKFEANDIHDIDGSSLKKMPLIEDEDLDRIQNISITEPSPYGRKRHDLVDPRGAWGITTHERFFQGWWVAYHHEALPGSEWLFKWFAKTRKADMEKFVGEHAGEVALSSQIRGYFIHVEPPKCEPSISWR